jgi:hypothetical protein
MSIQIQLSILKSFLCLNFFTKCNFFSFLTMKFHLETSASFEFADRPCWYLATKRKVFGMEKCKKMLLICYSDKQLLFYKIFILCPAPHIPACLSSQGFLHIWMCAISYFCSSNIKSRFYITLNSETGKDKYLKVTFVFVNTLFLTLIRRIKAILHQIISKVTTHVVEIKFANANH